MTDLARDSRRSSGRFARSQAASRWSEGEFAGTSPVEDGLPPAGAAARISAWPATTTGVSSAGSPSPRGRRRSGRAATP
ncbi:hypothetical protein, partial [Frankia sp. AgB1.9]|uniref:hypothetical protein n=1 Tax=Frankia sp. AgB1.9 TaxID=1836968 RepID=UPI001EE42BE1